MDDEKLDTFHKKEVIRVTLSRKRKRQEELNSTLLPETPDDQPIVNMYRTRQNFGKRCRTALTFFLRERKKQL